MNINSNYPNSSTKFELKLKCMTVYSHRRSDTMTSQCSCGMPCFNDHGQNSPKLLASIPGVLLTPILGGFGMFVMACTNEWDAIVLYLL